MVQLSDTHIAAATGVPSSLQLLIDWIAADPPDLVVHTGDIVWDDPDNATDRAFAHDVLGALRCPVAVIPGNHDVGFFDASALDHRLQAFRSTWGADRFVVDADGGWRLIGVDVYTVGQADADAWLAAAIDTPRPLAIFIHQPITGEPVDGWELPDRVGRRCAELLGGGDVRVVASGHRHCAVTRSDVGLATHVWAPSTTLTGERLHGGDPTPGAVEYHFEADTAWSHRFVDPATARP